jgi:hypothetical protein
MHYYITDNPRSKYNKASDQRMTVLEAIHRTNGTFFSVLYMKKDGKSIKKINGRIIKSKYREKINYFTMWTPSGFRTLNTDGVLVINANGKTIAYTGE